MDIINKVIYQFWTDDNPITENRKSGVESLRKNTNVKIEFLNKKEIEKKILPQVPLHPAYQYLSSVHKSDYLRCYFMHHFGGGYADIKHYSSNNNWDECFNYINKHPEVDVVGQKEIENGSPIKEYNTTQNLKRLVSNGYFIVRSYSEFSTQWWNTLNKKLDEKLNQLKNNPAVKPRDTRIEYPLKWSEIMGRIFHPICYKLWEKGKVKDLLNSGRMDIDYK